MVNALSIEPFEHLHLSFSWAKSELEEQQHGRLYKAVMTSLTVEKGNGSGGLLRRSQLLR